MSTITPHSALAASEAQLQTEQRISGIVESAMDAIISIDARQRIVLFNRAAAQVFRCSAEYALGRPLDEFIPERFRHAHREHVVRFGESRQTGRRMGALAVLFARRADGEEFPIEASISHVEVSGEKLFTVILRDVTERQRAAERLEHLHAVLRSTQRINQIIVHVQAPDALAQQATASLTETRGFDAAWMALFDRSGGLTATAESGLGPAFGPLGDSLTGRALPACALAAIEKPGAQLVTAFDSICENCPLRKAGEHRQAMAIRLDHGDRVHGVLTAYARPRVEFDREELGLLEELAGDLGLALHKISIEAEQKELETRYAQSQKMEAVGRLAGGIAHDFRNQLTVIGGYCDLALAQVGPGSLKEQLKEIAKAAERSNAMTAQLLAFSRTQVLHPETTNLNQVIGQLAGPLSTMLGEDIEVAHRLSPDLSSVNVDVAQLEQAILNIAANARDAMPGGGSLLFETKNVEIAPGGSLNPDAKPGAFVLLAISDTGAGMEESIRKRIFEPFFTTKERGKGTGLGLAMVYGFVTQSGGWISAYSEPGQGSTFKIFFPREPESASVEARSSEKAPSQLLRGHETVLLVEDELAVRNFVATVLRQSGYAVVAAASGAEALALSRAPGTKFDLLLSDVVMPGMSGISLAQQLNLAHPELKVLFVSGYTEGAIIKQGVLEPGVNYLPKPFSPAALAKKVRWVLDQPAHRASASEADPDRD